MPPVPALHQPTKLIEMVKAQTDVTELLKVVADCYRLSVTAERDIAEIAHHYELERQKSSHRHDEIMLALENEYAERAQQITTIERAAMALIERGQFELAQVIISQLLELQKTSVISTVHAQRSRSGI